MHLPTTKIQFVAFIFFVIISGCNKEKQADPALYIPDESELVELLTFNPVGFGANSKFSDTTMLVIQSASEWNQIQKKVPIPIDYPTLNWSQSQVLVVAVPTTEGGRSLTVDIIEKSDSVWVAHVLVNEPDTGCITTTATGLAAPFIVVYTAKTPLKFVLKLDTELYPCPELRFKN